MAALTVGMLAFGAGAAQPAEASVCFKTYVTVDGKHYGYRMPWCVYRTPYKQASVQVDRTMPPNHGFGAGLWVPVPSL